METKTNKPKNKRVVKEAVKAEENAPAKRISKTWEAALKYRDKPLIEIVDMKAVLK